MTDLKTDDLDEIDGLITAIESEFEEHFDPEAYPGMVRRSPKPTGLSLGYKARMKREEKEEQA